MIKRNFKNSEVVSLITISLCMIVKNEEEVLGDCLSSVINICDEIIIVDTGSTDQTKEIAEKFTNKIYDFKWIDDFSAARNFAFSKASMEYVFWLDADDVLYKADQEKFKKLKESLRKVVDCVSMLYILEIDNYGNPAFYFRRNRLVKRSNNFQWKGAVHEYLEVGGYISQSDIRIVHQKGKKKNTATSQRNIKIYENRLKKGEIFSPRDLYYYANELKDHQKYDKALLYYKKFLQGKKGWLEDNIRACLYMADIYRINNDEKKALQILLQTFEFDIPRPEPCCRLGDYFTEAKKYNLAIYWYELALQNDYQPEGFHYEAFSTWYPHLSLCMMYWRIGNKQKSFEHHEIVKKMRPNDPKVVYNQQFFN